MQRLVATIIENQVFMHTWSPCLLNQTIFCAVNEVLGWKFCSFEESNTSCLDAGSFVTSSMELTFQLWAAEEERVLSGMSPQSV
jgi:hypothetical protein